MPPELPSLPRRSDLRRRNHKFLNPTSAVKYALDKHGLTVTRQTVYNWIKEGRRGHKLRAPRDSYGYAIVPEDFDDYLHNHVL